MPSRKELLSLPGLLPHSSGQCHNCMYSPSLLNQQLKHLLRLLARFGSFEIFKPRDSETGRVAPSVGRVDILHQLLDYVIETFYPEVLWCLLSLLDSKFTCTCMYCLFIKGMGQLNNPACSLLHNS